MLSPKKLFTLSGWLGVNGSGLLVVSPTTQVRSSSCVVNAFLQIWFRGRSAASVEVIFLAIFLVILLDRIFNPGVCMYFYFCASSGLEWLTACLSKNSIPPHPAMHSPFHVIITQHASPAVAVHLSFKHSSCTAP